MPVKKLIRQTSSLAMLALSLSGCFHPPYNNFQKPPPPVKRAALGAGAGIVTGSLVGGTVLSGAIGGVIGGTIGTFSEIYHETPAAVIQDLAKNDIQFVRRGDTMALIVPTDHYYEFNSPKLNDLCFEGLNNIIILLKLYKCSVVNVAAFTDNVGSKQHKKRLTDARAEAMLTFLWANNIPARQISAEGYGDKFDVGDNHWIHGSAYNRRIEIQWQNKVPVLAEPIENGMK